LEYFAFLYPKPCVVLRLEIMRTRDMIASIAATGINSAHPAPALAAEKPETRAALEAAGGPEWSLRQQ
jgi:hypothetical protein